MKLAVKGLSPGEVAAFCYADVFGVVLSRNQAKLWSINTQKKFNPPTLCPDLTKKNSYAQEKKILAQKITKDLVLLPFIEAIFLTGDVATGICAQDSDVDLMIITRPNALWITRLLVVSRLKKRKIYKKLVCPNIFLDTNHLLIKERNLYTAHEILQAQCLFDRHSINFRWLSENEWTKNYLPNAYKYKTEKMPESPGMTSFWLVQNLLWPFELIAFLLQYLYMRSKITNEKIGLGFAFFHPRKLSSHILQEYQKRLKLTR